MRMTKHDLSLAKPQSGLPLPLALPPVPAERFRHEKYVCKSVSFDLESIIVNDTDIGGEVKIIGYRNDRTAIIKAISDNHIEIEDSRMKLELDRNDGSVRISRGTDLPALRASAVFSPCKSLLELAAW